MQKKTCKQQRKLLGNVELEKTKSEKCLKKMKSRFTN